MRKTEIKIQFIISLYLICFQFENAGKAKKKKKSFVVNILVGFIHRNRAESLNTGTGSREFMGRAQWLSHFPSCQVSYSRMALFHLARFMQRVVFPPQIRSVVHIHSPRLQLFHFPQVTIAKHFPDPKHIPFSVFFNRFCCYALFALFMFCPFRLKIFYFADHQ